MDDELELVHDRDYSVQVFRSSPNELVARGRVRDEKPPGLYVEHDPDPLTMHDMTIELRVGYPSLEITDASVRFTTFPQLTCPGISNHYRSLVGVSIARGFTHKVRELFGGPRGCAHVTALLQAMAPAVVQSTWSMRVLNRREGADGESTPVADPKAATRAGGAAQPRHLSRVGGRRRARRARRAWRGGDAGHPRARAADRARGRLERTDGRVAPALSR